MSKRSDAEDLRGAARLLVDATLGVTRVVESMHRTIGSGPALLGRPLALPWSWTVAPVYRAIQAATKGTGVAVDLALRQLSPLLSERTPGHQRLALQAALNGVLGDWLEATANPLALSMILCRAGSPLPLDRASLRAAFPLGGRRLLVLVHGSSLYDGHWRREGHDHGAFLEETQGWTALHLRYNSGRHISTNGRELASLLERLVQGWPGPIEELALLGHSMGGLVARSACDIAQGENQAWRSKLGRLVCLASPHHGAALERAGNWVDFLLEINSYSAPLAALGKIRSAGVTDLRHGSVRDADWMARDRFAKRPDPRAPLPLPGGVSCYAVAATRSRPSSARPRSDGLVSVASALGQDPRPAFTLAFPERNRLVVYETDHVGVLSAPAVAQALARWLSA